MLKEEKAFFELLLFNGNEDFDEIYDVYPYKILVLEDYPSRYLPRIEFENLEEISVVREVCREVKREILDLEIRRIDLEEILRTVKDKIKAKLIEKRFHGDIEKYTVIGSYEVLKLSRIAPFLLDKEVEEFFIDGWDSRIYLTHSVYGKMDSDIVLTKEEIEEMIKEIKDYAEEGESFIEIDKREILIVQLRNYRIVATRPPLSDGLELTAVRPVVKLSLLDYNLPPELIKRLSEGAEGILIAGAPGEGKTTFAQALAEFYRDKGKVVKTIEAPRDLQLPDDITQYSKTIANAREMHDILLLSRPDYTIFDEMRNDEDFKLYMDLRLAGVGMVGVVHATTPIDAIQRFVERIDLGMIPSILDTVIFIKNGAVKKVYEVKLVAKVPHGLKREDLARPIVEVRDFFTKRKEYEMYIFGKRIFVIPLKKGRDLDFQNLVEGIIRGELGEYAAWVKVEFISDKEATVYVPEDRFNVIKRRIKRKLRRIERKFGISLFLKPMEETSGYSPFNLIE